MRALDHGNHQGFRAMRALDHGAAPDPMIPCSIRSHDPVQPFAVTSAATRAPEDRIT